MKKRGFTLIELLAVIIVLTIIALIATPIVMNIIQRSKKGAVERGAENYIKEAKTQILALKTNGNTIEDGMYTLDSNGNICLNKECTDKLEIMMNGTKPNKGRIKIENKEIVGYTLTIGEDKNRYGDYSVLPSEYEEVDYIESTGTQYIDTEINLLDYNNLKYYTNIQNITSDGYVFRYVTTNNVIKSLKVSKENLLLYSNNSWYLLIKSDYENLYSEIEFDFSALTLSVNNIDLSRSTTSSNYPLDTPKTNILGSSVIGKTFSIVIYDGDDVLREFIPCYRKSDKEVGMFDIANNRFYSNAGTGNFIAGPEV